MIAALGYGSIFYWHSLNIWVTKSQNNRILLGLDEEMLDSLLFDLLLFFKKMTIEIATYV
jgi:hypothetical protein